jgi:hypothetical protein
VSFTKDKPPTVAVTDASLATSAETSVFPIIRHLRSKKAMGPDRNPMKPLQELAMKKNGGL